MVIEESILIASPIEKVWNIFTDLACWSKWNTVMEEVSSESLHSREGGSFRFCIRPFVIPVYLEPVIEEVVPGKKIAWRGEISRLLQFMDIVFRKLTSLTHHPSAGNIFL